MKNWNWFIKVKTDYTHTLLFPLGSRKLIDCRLGRLGAGFVAGILKVAGFTKAVLLETAGGAGLFDCVVFWGASKKMIVSQ